VRSKVARVRFYAELNQFLRADRRGRAFEYSFWVEPSVKDVIESCGVPHTEVELVVANGCSVSFDYSVKDGDLVSVYPMFESIDITPLLRVRPQPLRLTRFVLDTHLGRLARYLRMLGLDASYSADTSDRTLATTSSDEGRILLTRDRGLLMRRTVTHGHYVPSTIPRRQLVEVIERFDLWSAIRPFTRCMKCNGVLEPTTTASASGLIPERIRQRYERFQRCPVCKRFYWEGSHQQRMREFIDAVVKEIPRK